MDSLIVKLPESTIQKIAAGEVITRPSNVIKELMENSIDAGATNIRITIEQGGLKLIEVVDNGHGIARFNSNALCQRYATSKLSTPDDLRRISTFGFRGEALASISEMAEVQVKSFNMKTDKAGWQATYKQGVPVSPIVEKYLQLPGTQIKVTQLFSLAKPRRDALSSAYLDEKKIIHDLVMKFAIHHRERITISLRDGSTMAGTDLICSIAPAAIQPSFGSFYGVEMENNLMEFHVDKNDSDDSFKAKIYVAFSYKKSTSNIHQSNLILFVNNRLVECSELRREMGALVLECLNLKQFFSVFYVCIEIPPEDVDVNTHPAKETVTIHNQTEILALILQKLRQKFQENLSSQVVATKIASQKTIGELLRQTNQATDSSQSSANNDNSSKAINDQRLKLLAPNCLVAVQQQQQQQQQQSSLPPQATPVKRPYELNHTDPCQPNLSQLKIPPSRYRRDLKLKSIHDLREQVALSKSKEHLDLIKKSVFVGLFDCNRALIQHETKLFAINFRAYLEEQLYQFYLFDFANFPPIDILPPGNKISFMIDIHLNDIRKHEADHFRKLKYATPGEVIDKLLTHKQMLQDYISIDFTQEEILTIPCIIPTYVPTLAYLGRFLIDLANQVDFSDELKCFRQIGRTLAAFYSKHPVNMSDKRVHKRYHDLVNTRLYEAIKRYLLVPDRLFTKDNICQITDTKDLYKVFERC